MKRGLGQKEICSLVINLTDKQRHQLSCDTTGVFEICDSCGHHGHGDGYVMLHSFLTYHGDFVCSNCYMNNRAICNSLYPPL
jgi:hypothetical protein